MKANIILLSICFVLLSITSKAQSYIPFPKQNTTWHSLVKWLHPQSNKGGECINTWTRIVGDTVINGNSYSILEDSVVRYGCLNGFLCIPTFLGSSVRTLGYLRNDSINKKVFVRSVDSSFDALVYDFNMQFGDTITTASKARALYGLYPTTYVVDSISFIFIAGKNRKVFYVYDPQKRWNRFEIIEGIGSSGGFLSSQYVDNLNRTELVCYDSPLIGAYSPSNSCPLSTSIESSAIDAEELQIYPNPTNGIVYIESTADLKEVNVYNSAGEKILNHRPQSSKFNFEILGARGLYFIQLQLNNGDIKSQKIVFQ